MKDSVCNLYSKHLILLFLLVSLFYSCRKGGCGTNWKNQPLRDSLIKNLDKLSTKDLELFFEKGKSPDPHYDAIYSYELGKRYCDSNKISDAITWHEKSIEEAKLTNDTILIINALNELSYDYLRADFSMAAKENAVKAIDLSNTILKNNPQNKHAIKASIYSLRRLGHAYMEMGEYNDARKCFYKALINSRLIDDIFEASRYEACIGTTYEKEKQIDSAGYYFNLALMHFMFENHPLGVSYCYLHLGNVFKEKGDIQQAIELYEAGFNAIQGVDGKIEQLASLKNLIISLNSINKQDRAYRVCLDGLALAKKYEFTEDQIFILRNLREYYVKKGDLHNAIKVDTEADKLDEILKKKKELETLNQVELNYIQNKNKEEIQKITKEKDREVNQRDVINILLILLVIIIIVTSIVTYYLLRLKYKHSKQIRELMQSKANLYGNLVKDFRSPLTIIMGYSEYIKHKNKDIDPEELVRMLEIVENKTLELINLANQMLTVDKVKGDGHYSQWIEGNISLFVQMITENFSDLTEDESNNLSFDTIAWNMEVSFVPYLLDQILNHLFIYAIARSDKDTTIHISINKESKERYSIAISTNSSEMNAEKLLTTFEAKGISSDSRETDMGFRIDLSYVRQLINIINGKIEIDQKDNTTTFKIILPCRYNSSFIEAKVKGLNKTDIANAALNVVNSIIESTKKKNDRIEVQEIDDQQISLDEEDIRDLILVVEDNKEVAGYIKRILSDQYQVIIAHSGEEAIEKTNEYYPDLIVLNRVLKGMSGTETCKVIKGDKKTSYIPVIMLTSTGKFDEQNQSLRGGADAYLMKPFLEEDLINSIGNILRLCHSLRNSIEKSYTLKTKENVIAAGEKDFANNKSQQEDFNKEESSNQTEEKKRTTEESDKATDPDKLEGYDKEFFENLSKCISDNISDPDFDRNEMASALNISLSQLSRKVKSLTGQSPSAYIRKIRISCAEELLRGTTKTITDVAYELGFRDYQSFLRAFKSEMGYLPSQSQKQGNENQIDIQ